MSSEERDLSQGQAVGEPGWDPRMILTRMTVFTLLMGGCLYASAGRLDWYPGWALIALEIILALIAIYLFQIDPELEEERTRIKAGVKPWDKWIVLLLSPWMPFGLLILAGLDRRFGWSGSIPAALAVGAFSVAFAGRMLAIWASAANRFYGRFVRIQHERGHHVIDTGPYRHVRHPGYLGVAVYLLSTGLVLGSWWTVAVNIFMALILVLRTALEDRTLQRELGGYLDYARKVRYRLIPGLW
jgi:protein-S-isoprenylcysteine O-methyltransferase Ste14